MAKSSTTPTADSSKCASDFEKRLQYAMQQSLILQERQLKDIETLQVELGDEPTALPHRAGVQNKKVVIEKIRRPLKGILKKAVVRYVGTCCF